MSSELSSSRSTKGSHIPGFPPKLVRESRECFLSPVGREDTEKEPQPLSVLIMQRRYSAPPPPREPPKYACSSLFFFLFPVKALPIVPRGARELAQTSESNAAKTARRPTVRPSFAPNPNPRCWKRPATHRCHNQYRRQRLARPLRDEVQADLIHCAAVRAFERWIRRRRGGWRQTNGAGVSKFDCTASQPASAPSQINVEGCSLNNLHTPKIKIKKSPVPTLPTLYR